MTWVDLAVLGFVALSGLLAFGRGLVREILGIGAWVGAVALAIFALPYLHGPVSQYVHTEEYIGPASFVVAFIITLIVLMLAAHVVGRLVRNSALGGLDRTLGLIFGLARGAVIVMVAYFIGSMITPVSNWPEVVRNARLVWPTYQAADWVRMQLPESIRPTRLQPPTAGRDTTAEALFRATPQGSALRNPAGRANGRAGERE